jgi:hypothetical protein
VGSTDRAYLRAHPWRYARFFWPHVAVAVALIINAFAVSGPIFDIVLGYGYWPPGMAAVGLLMLGSSFRPLNYRVQAVAGAALFSMSVFRILAYVQLLVAGAVPNQYRALVWSFIAHWILAAGVAVLWPRVSELSALRATVAAGREREAEGRGMGGVA